MQCWASRSAREYIQLTRCSAVRQRRVRIKILERGWSVSNDLSNSICYENSDGSIVQWQNIVCKNYYNVDIINRNGGAKFPASLVRRPIASAELMQLDVAAYLMVRSRAEIARDNYCNVQFAYVVDGEGEFSQLGRTCHFKANDCLIIDQGNPFELANNCRVQNLAIDIPRSWVSRHLVVEDVAAKVIGTDCPWGAALAANLRAIYAGFGSIPATSAPLLVDQALVLAALTFGAQEIASGSTHQKFLLRQTRSIMQELYHEEDLSPARVAKLVGISKSYIHAIFAGAGTTFCTELDELRVNRAAALLESRSQRHLTINEIGIRCGLPSAPHFTRKFRSLKGVAPSQFRQLALGECA